MSFLRFVLVTSFLLLLSGLGLASKVYIIPDVHFAPIVQKAIVDLLDTFQPEVVLVEGGWGKADINLLPKDVQLRRRLVDAGILSGAEFWASLRNERLLVGMEVPSLYEEQLELYRSLRRERQRNKEYLATIGLYKVPLVSKAVDLALSREEALAFVSSPLSHLPPLDSVRRFYILAYRREVEFVDFVVRYSNEGKDVAVIVGGYHAQFLARALAEKGMDVEVIYPKVHRMPESGLRIEWNVIPLPLLTLRPGRSLSWMVSSLLSRGHPCFALPMEVKEAWIERLKENGLEDLVDLVAENEVGQMQGDRVVLIDEILQRRGVSQERARRVWVLLNQAFKERLGLEITPQVVHFHELLHYYLGQRQGSLREFFEGFSKEVNGILDKDDWQRFKVTFSVSERKEEELIILFAQWEYFFQRGRDFLLTFLSEEEVDELYPVLARNYELLMKLISVGEDVRHYTKSRLRSGIGLVSKFYYRYLKPLPKDLVQDGVAFLLFLSTNFPYLSPGFKPGEVFDVLDEHISWSPGISPDLRRGLMEFIAQRSSLVIGVRGGESALAYSLLAGMWLRSEGKRVTVVVYPSKVMNLSQELLDWMVDSLAESVGLPRIQVVFSEKETQVDLGINSRGDVELVREDGRIEVKKVKRQQGGVFPSRIDFSKLDLGDILALGRDLFPFVEVPSIGPEDLDVAGYVMNFPGEVMFLTRGKSVLGLLTRRVPSSDRILVVVDREIGAWEWIKLARELVARFGIKRGLGELFKNVEFLLLPPALRVYLPEGGAFWPDTLSQEWQVWVLAKTIERQVAGRRNSGFVRRPERDKAFLPDWKEHFFKGAGLPRISELAKAVARSSPAKLTGEFLDGRGIFTLPGFRVYQMARLPERPVVKALERIGASIKDRVGSYLKVRSKDDEVGFVLSFLVVSEKASRLSGIELVELKERLREAGMSWPHRVELEDLFVKDLGDLVCLRPDLLFSWVELKDRTAADFWDVVRDKLEEFVPVDRALVEKIEVESGWQSISFDWDRFVKIKDLNRMIEVISQMTGLSEEQLAKRIKTRKQAIAVMKRAEVVVMRIKVGDQVVVRRFWFYPEEGKVAVIGLKEGKYSMVEYRLEFFSEVFPRILEKWDWLSEGRRTSLGLYWQAMKRFGCKRVFYPASGSDVFTPMLVFDPDELVMLDLLPWGSETDTDISRREIEEYLANTKKRSGFLLGSVLRERGEIGRFVLVEIIGLLGGKEVSVRRVSRNEVVVEFYWRHPLSQRRSKRKVRFLFHPDGLNGLFGLTKTRGPYDAVLLKAGENFWREVEGVETKMKEMLSPRGVILSDFEPISKTDLRKLEEFPKELFLLCYRKQVGIGYIPSNPGFLLSFYPREVWRVKADMEEIDPSLDAAWNSSKGKVSLFLKKGGQIAALSGGFEDWQKDWKRFLTAGLRFLAKDFSGVLISRFLRNPKAYFFFEQEILPQLIKRVVERGGVLRVVSVGAARGEEVSTMMYLLEPFLKQNKDLKVEFYLLDQDVRALKEAEEAVFSEREFEEGMFTWKPNEKIWKKRGKFFFVPVNLENEAWRRVVRKEFLPERADVVLYNYVDLYISPEKKLEVREWVLSLVKKDGALMTDVDYDDAFENQSDEYYYFGIDGVAARWYWNRGQ